MSRLLQYTLSVECGVKQKVLKRTQRWRKLSSFQTWTEFPGPFLEYAVHVWRTQQDIVRVRHVHNSRNIPEHSGEKWRLWWMSTHLPQIFRFLLYSLMDSLGYFLTILLGGWQEKYPEDVQGNICGHLHSQTKKNNRIMSGLQYMSESSYRMMNDDEQTSHFIAFTCGSLSVFRLSFQRQYLSLLYQFCHFSLRSPTVS